MSYQADQEILRQLWKPLRLTRSEVVDLLLHARVPAFRGRWAQKEEAAYLILARLLRDGIRKHARLSAQVTTAEERSVIDAARRLAYEVEKLRQLEGGPPQIPVDDRGRSVWEAWARSGKGLSRPGRTPKTDPEIVGRLTAFYQLALHQKRPNFSWADDAPLTRYLRACFEFGERRVLAWQERRGYSGRPHALHAPSPSALREQLEKLGDNTENTDFVNGLFEQYVAKFMPADKNK